MSHVSDGFFAFPPSFPHQQRILQFSLALFVSCDKILSKTERYDNTMRKTALPTDRLSETARQKLSRFEAWLLRNGKSYQTIRSYLYTARHFLSLYPEVSHDNLMLYKCCLIDHYKPSTVNLRIRAMNCFMEFLDLPASRVLMVRLQQKPFLENVISQADYEYLKKMPPARWKTHLLLCGPDHGHHRCADQRTSPDPCGRYDPWADGSVLKRR